MLVSDFNYELPEELIAQEPAPERAGARMLALERASGEWRDTFFAELPGLLRPGDVLVLNDSRVIPARLFGARPGRPEETIEVLLTRQEDPWQWRALVRPARKAAVGERILFAGGGAALAAEVTGRGEYGERLLRFSPVEDFFAQLDRLGHVPLPPYVRRLRGSEDRREDRERYQTVFARERGSAAAPTAGLHFTPEILGRIQERGVRVCRVTLHVGLGTFQPVRVEEVKAIRLHAERYTLPGETAEEINAALDEGRRVVAVGTTVVRTLEHCGQSGRLTPHSGETEIFLSPGDRFRVVGGLLTNFHLPQSTLLMLVSAFAGRERVLAAYRHAVTERYRFFSYGDCMFVS